MTHELIILEGPQAGRRLPVGATATTFGRSPAASQSFPQDNFMSSLHMTAESGPGGVVLNDLRSTNGTFVDGERITQVVAGTGAVIKIGSLTMQVVSPDQPKAGPVLSSPMPGVSTRAASVTSTFILPPRHSGVLNVLSKAEGSLFCLLDAAADGMLPSLLALAVERKESLYEGNGAGAEASQAPYLIALSADSTLLRVLVEKGWGKGWASYFTSALPFEAVRQHFGKFLMVQLEQGKEVYFRFYDPQVLREFLPTASREELTMFFGPVTEWMIETDSSETVLKARNGLNGLVFERMTPTVRLPQPTSASDAGGLGR